VVYTPNSAAGDGGTGEEHTEFVPLNVPYTISGLELFTNSKGLTLNGWVKDTKDTYYYEGETYEDDAGLTLNALWSNGSVEYPYLIWHQCNFRGGLEYINTFGPDKYYQVAQGFKITPPYTAPQNFSGTFDGNEKTIEWDAETTTLNPTRINDGTYAIGIFASVMAPAEIKNFAVKGEIKFTCKDGEVEAGGIAGLALGSAGSMAAIENCHSDVNIRYVLPAAASDYQDTDIGGIAGGINQDGCNIQNCAALNYKVDGGTSENRIAAKESAADLTYSNNYGYEYMVGQDYWTDEDDNHDGADVNFSGMEDDKQAEWWEDTLGWAYLFGSGDEHREENPWKSVTGKPPVLWFEVESRQF